MTRKNGARLDSLSIIVLNALSNTEEGRLNTSEAKAETGIPDNDKVRRRFKTLEREGLVELGKEETYDTPIPPTVATLTEDGWEYVENKVGDLGGAESLVERIEYLESQLHEMRQVMNAFGMDAQPEEDVNPVAIKKGMVAIQRYLREEANADLRKYHPDNQHPDN